MCLNVCSCVCVHACMCEYMHMCMHIWARVRVCTRTLQVSNWWCVEVKVTWPNSTEDASVCEYTLR